MKCNNCGAQINEESKNCQFCGTVCNSQNVGTGYNQYVNKTVIQNKEKSEDILMGALGALVGSLAGAAIIILLYQLGVVASVAGFAMAFCTFALYEKLAGKLSAKGIIICSLIMLLMTFLAENLAISIQIARNTPYDTFFVFKNFFKLIKSANLVTEYILDLSLVIVFNIVGAFSTVRNKLKSINSK